MCFNIAYIEGRGFCAAISVNFASFIISPFANKKHNAQIPFPEQSVGKIHNISVPVTGSNTYKKSLIF